MSSHLIEEHENGVATLTMNRPEALNAFSGEMMSGLQEALPRLASDSSVRVVVLTGTGRAFSAGGDVKGFASSSAPVTRPADRSANARSVPTFEQRTRGLRASTEMVELLHEMPKPTVACIPGVAAGGGFSVALACDIRLCNASARFTSAFAKLAVSGDYGGSYFLTRLVGTAKAKELYFSSRIIGAEEALNIGLVNHVYPDEEYDESVKSFVATLGAMPPIALEYMKKNLNAAIYGSLSEVLDLEAIHMTRTFSTKDHMRGAQAFVTKKPAVFEGN